MVENPKLKERGLESRSTQDMETIVQAVEQIRSLHDSYVDTSFRQGLEAVWSQIKTYTDDQEHAPSVAAEFIAHAPNLLAELQKRVAPAHLPEDHIFFLEFYGGLSLYTGTREKSFINVEHNV